MRRPLHLISDYINTVAIPVTHCSHSEKPLALCFIGPVLPIQFSLQTCWMLMAGMVFCMAGSFDVLIYTDKDAEVPFNWGESGPHFITNSEEVRLRSFTTTIHKVDAMVAFKKTDWKLFQRTRTAFKAVSRNWMFQWTQTGYLCPGVRLLTTMKVGCYSEGGTWI